MKINITHNKITKSLLLASAFVALSFSSAYAGNYSAPENGSNTYTGITDLSGGNITIGSAGSLTFRDSSLGTQSSRFSFAIAPRVSIYGSQTFELNNTTAYVGSMDFSQDVSSTDIRLNANSILNSTANISNGGGSIHMNSSSLFAPRVDYYEMYVMTGSKAILEGHFGTVNVHDSSKWTALSGSRVGYLDLQDSTFRVELGNVRIENFTLTNSTIELLSNSPYDTAVIRIQDFYIYGNNILKYEFTDEFIEMVMDGYDEEYPFVFSVTYGFMKVNTYGSGTWSYGVASSSDSYTWTVTDLGSGQYRFTDFTLIPEPSTYAMVFGVLALGLAIYRRRK